MDTIRPMTLTLGGIPAPENTVGRAVPLGDVMDSLPGHGALLTGDRRYGKTSLARLVEATCQERGYNVVRISAERLVFDDFVAALADGLEATGSPIQREIDRWRIDVRLTVGPVTAERMTTVRNLDTLVRAALRADSGAPLVLAIDEIPVLAKAMEADVAGSGSELLHLLRRLRQEHTNRLAMVLSGSIGFHHVTRDVHGATNDVVKVPVGPLEGGDAVYLARCLLLGERVASTDELALGRGIADAAERIPYYVQHLVKGAREHVRRLGRPVRPEDIVGLVDAAFLDPDDPWDLKHYRHRIRSYYGEPDEALVVELLDIYAASSSPVSIGDVTARVAVSGLPAQPERTALVALVDRLEADHYLVRVDDERSQFATGLVRRAWRAAGRR